MNKEDIEKLKTEVKSRAESENIDLSIICFKGEPLDDALQRFLQARKFVLDDTVAKIKEAVKWRTEVARVCVELGKAGCLKCDVEEITQFYRGNYAGHCKEGRPIWYEQTGNVDIPSLHCLTSNDRFLKYHVCLMEELQDKYEESSKRLGKTINKTLSILDLDGLTMSKISSETIEFVKMIAKVDSSNYPETMGKMFIINAPGIFTVAWGMIKAFLDPRTVSKIEILGGPQVWKPRLLELIESDQLPAELGGTGPPCLPTLKCFTEVELASGKQHKAELVIDQPNEKIMLKFFTRNGGLGFKLIFTDATTNQTVDLIPQKTYDTECTSGNNVNHTIQVPGEKGTVTAIWDNQNWFGRTILYRLVKR